MKLLKVFLAELMVVTLLLGLVACQKKENYTIRFHFRNYSESGSDPYPAVDVSVIIKNTRTGEEIPLEIGNYTGNVNSFTKNTEEFEEYAFPSTTIMSSLVWYAGGGNNIYVTNEKGKITVFEREEYEPDAEMGENDSLWGDPIEKKSIQLRDFNEISVIDEEIVNLQR